MGLDEDIARVSPMRKASLEDCCAVVLQTVLAVQVKAVRARCIASLGALATSPKKAIVWESAAAQLTLSGFCVDADQHTF